MKKQYKYITWSLLGLILLLAAFLRFYRIREYLTFLGDEGRDVLVVKHMIVDHKFTLLGPVTSVGSMYMGPAYYYLMVPFLWAWQLDPVGPAIMVALFALATIFLIYKMGEEFFSAPVGLIAALFYTISPLTITYGRASWNPNVVPFFSMLVMYSLMHVVIRRQYKYMILMGVSLGILIQLHYVTLLFLPIIFISLAFIKFRVPFHFYVYGLLAFIAGYSPFLLFEFRHQFVNTKAVWKFFWQQKTETQAQGPTFLATVNDVSVRIFWRLIVIGNAEVTKAFMVGLVIMLGYYWKKIRTTKDISLAFLIIITWLIGGILAYGLYRGSIYDYYFGSLFPLPFLLTGLAFVTLWRSAIGKGTVIAVGALLVYYNVMGSPLLHEPNNLLKNTETIARFVYDKAGNDPYNFALIAGKNSDHAYRYFLEIWGKTPVAIENPVVDPDRKTVTNQLLIVCEDKICQPLGHPLWEIAGFGPAEITDEWKVSTARVFKLEHAKNN
jgi:4-amino-4-deoxy-L-arabinose transferase-like glycosyltransferase